MTKRKRAQTGLFSLFMLLSSVASSKGGEQQPVEAPQKRANSTAQVLTKSALTALLTDSMDKDPAEAEALATENNDLAIAPKVNLNPKAASFVKSYLKENRETLEIVEQRSNYYFQTISTIFRQYGLPEELKYLAVVESKLKPSATSRAGAAGLWQLMPSTARSLGLKVSGKTDERRQFYKSTVAAAKYLKSLYTQYGDWLLVLAAYNAGSGNVNKAIRLSGSRNFWTLQQFLPGETKSHVKRYIGAHYYFEQQGSLTTLTKAEWLDYQKTLAAFEQASLKEEEAFEALMEISQQSVSQITMPPTLTKESRGK